MTKRKLSPRERLRAVRQQARRQKQLERYLTQRTLEPSNRDLT